jgi:hypothetical protein
MQVGFTVMARFAGTGPKYRPDMELFFPIQTGKTMT